MRIQNHVLATLLVAAVGAGAACKSGETSSNGGGTGKGGSTSSGSGKGGTTTTTTTGAGGTTTTTTTGAGGVTTTTTGAGGSTGTQALCATKITPMQPVVLNFENYDGTVTPDKYGAPYGGPTPNSFPPGTTTYPTAGPYAYGDGSATPTLAILAGHPPSNWAISETVMQAKTWGMGGGFYMPCTNATAYKGVSFWVRGTSQLGTFGFGLVMDSVVLPADGGTCTGTTDTCKPAAKNDIPLTADWTQVNILWSDFTPGMNGSTTVTPNGDNVTGLQWNVGLQYVLDPAANGDANGAYIPMAGDLTINIDDVQFIQ